jgi:hypothetical protein
VLTNRDGSPSFPRHENDPRDPETRELEREFLEMWQDPRLSINRRVAGATHALNRRPRDDPQYLAQMQRVEDRLDAWRASLAEEPREITESYASHRENLTGWR